jgi:hypothetical protein
MKYRKIFKVEAQGDTLYINAENEAHANQRLTKFTGPIPRPLLTFTEVKELPEGEELL